MTDWDEYYLMKKPTDLSDLYPDIYGHFDKLEDERFQRIMKRIVWVATAAIAATLIVAGLYVYDQIQTLPF